MKLCFPIHQSRTVFSSLGMFKISISENPLSYHNLQSLLSPHFSGLWHYCWLFFRFMTPIVGKLFCPISFIYFLWVSCPFASIVDTTVPPTSNFLALLPMCFCCSDTGWCKLLCQQLYCWSTPTVPVCWVMLAEIQRPASWLKGPVSLGAQFPL